MGILVIGEDCSVKRAALLRERILRELAESSEIVLDFDNVQHIDLAVAQLVLAAMKSAREQRKTIRVHNAVDSLKKQFILTGILKEG